mmetsp:Transcript_18225/g.46121  ORF Transcript_18225/g.46121 Transcript_18225/m.46121 type:complete len:233 (+) Transcript_18225:175-873(+)
MYIDYPVLARRSPPGAQLALGGRRGRLQEGLKVVGEEAVAAAPPARQRQLEHRPLRHARRHGLRVQDARQDLDAVHQPRARPRKVVVLADVDLAVAHRRQAPPARQVRQLRHLRQRALQVAGARRQDEDLGRVAAQRVPRDLLRAVARLLQRVEAARKALHVRQPVAAQHQRRQPLQGDHARARARRGGHLGHHAPQALLQAVHRPDRDVGHARDDADLEDACQHLGHGARA